MGVAGIWTCAKLPPFALMLDMALMVRLDQNQFPFDFFALGEIIVTVHVEQSELFITFEVFLSLYVLLQKVWG